MPSSHHLLEYKHIHLHGKKEPILLRKYVAEQIPKTLEKSHLQIDMIEMKLQTRKCAEGMYKKKLQSRDSLPFFFFVTWNGMNSSTAALSLFLSKGAGRKPRSDGIRCNMYYAMNGRPRLMGLLGEISHVSLPRIENLIDVGHVWQGH